MKTHSEKKSYNKHIRKTWHSILFGFIATFICIAAYRLTGGEILCTAIENLVSPNLMLFVASSAFLLHALSIFCTKLRETTEKFYSFATELASLLTGTALTLFIFYYYEDFGFKYHDILIPASIILTKTFVLISMLTALPLFILLNYQLNIKNYNKGKNLYISLGVVCLAAIGFGFTLFGEKIDPLYVCEVDNNANLSFNIPE